MRLTDDTIVMGDRLLKLLYFFIQQGALLWLLSSLPACKNGLFFLLVGMNFQMPCNGIGAKPDHSLSMYVIPVPIVWVA